MSEADEVSHSVPNETGFVQKRREEGQFKGAQDSSGWIGWRSSHIGRRMLAELIQSLPIEQRAGLVWRALGLATEPGSQLRERRTPQCCVLLQAQLVPLIGSSD